MIGRNVEKSLLALLLVLTSVSVSYGQLRAQGRYLVDRCGRKVVFRGIDEPMNRALDPLSEIGEMAKTGMNALRVVSAWDGKNAYTLEQWTALLDSCRKYNLYAIIAAGHSSTEFFAKPEVKAMIEPRKDWVMFDGIQEVTGTAEAWRDTALARVGRIREAGYDLPILLTSNNYGRNWRTICKYSPEVYASDPQKNLVFCVQGYYANRGDYKEAFDSLALLPYPVQIGVCRPVASPWTDHTVHMRHSIDLCHQHDFSWMVWAWFLYFQNHDDNMSLGSKFGDWQPAYDYWGRYIALESPYGMMNTVTNYPLVAGQTCATEQIPASPVSLECVAKSDRRIDLSWVHDLEDCHGFIIERSDNGGVWKQIHKVGRVLDYSDNWETGLHPSTQYSYRVKAYNLDAGNSAASNTDNASTASAFSYGSGKGITALYYPDQFLQKNLPSVERVDSAINFDWFNEKTWKKGVPDSNSFAFGDASIRFLGYIEPRYSEEYTWYLRVKGRANLWIDTFLIVSANAPSLGQYIGMKRMVLEKGKKYPVRLEAEGQNEGKGFGMKLMWMSLSEPFAEVPSSQYHPDSDCPADLKVSMVRSSYISLEWKDRSQNESGFVVERKGPEDESFVKIADLPADSTFFTDSNLTPATVYVYRVAAKVGSALTQYSNTVSVSTVSPRNNLVEWSATGKLRGYDTLFSMSNSNGINGPVAMVRGTGLKDHGYRGWAHHKPHVVIDDFAAALDSGDYVHFTVTPQQGVTLDLDYLLVNVLRVPKYDYSYALFSSADNYSSTFATFKQSGTTKDVNDTIRFPISMKGVEQPLSFRVAITCDSADDFSNVISFKDTLGVMAFELAGTAHGVTNSSRNGHSSVLAGNISSITVLDLKGRTLFKAENEIKRADKHFLSDLKRKWAQFPAGVYIVSIRYNAGSRNFDRTELLSVGVGGQGIRSLIIR